MTGKYTDWVGDTVDRPWGSYEILAQGDGYQTKRIRVASTGRLSYQKHFKRAEVWIVVKGIARVTLDDVEKTYEEGQVVQIGREVKHRLANPGTDDLVLIEIQTGAYLGEDDIERYSDDYGRLGRGV